MVLSRCHLSLSLQDGFIFSLSICYRPVGRRIATHTELEDSFEYREYNRIE